MFADLDVVGWDCYPVQFDANPPAPAMALLQAIARGYKDGRRYWMLEQQSGSPMGMVADDPRRSRLWAWQSVAHGAEMVLYFRWRTCRFGGEQYWRGILDHDGRPNPRHAMVSKTGREISRLGAWLDGLSRQNPIAFLLDFDSLQSHFVNPLGPSFAYRDHAQQLFSAIRKLGLGVDVVYEPPPPGKYQALIAPAMRLMDEDWAGRIRQFVSAGGTLVTTIAAATLNRDHVAPEDPLPWLLTDVFGLCREEWSALGKLTAPPKERMGEDQAAWGALNRADVLPVLAGDDALKGNNYLAEKWADHLAPTTARTWARFAVGSPVAGLPAVTINDFGRGRAVYIAALVNQPLLDDLAAALFDPPADQPAGTDPDLELVPCRNGSKKVCFALNHGPAPATLNIPPGWHDILNNHPAPASMRIEPYDLAILEE
jgi:beta-galactosidase